MWTPFVDRADLTKQLVLLLVGAAVCSVALASGLHRAGRITAALGWLVGLGLLALPHELGARIEGVAGWIGAILLGWGARRADPDLLQRGLAWLAGGVGALAVLQGLGLDVFGGTRPITGTLGGPGQLGWTLALLLPFCGAAGLRWAPALGALAVAGLVLSGSRTGWVMAVAVLPLWVWESPRPRVWRGLLAGLLLGVAVDAATGRAGLPARFEDLSASEGTAAGRGYLWRVYASRPDAWLGAGRGPEAFVRTFPQLQRDWLVGHPEDAAFRSDLRHAHADVVEVGTNFGLLGIALLGWLLIRVGRAGPWRTAPVAVVASVLIGGLAAPVLFFAPTLALGTVAVAMRLRGESPRLAGGVLPLLVVSVVVGAWMARRVASETVRSDATWLRVTGRLPAARPLARQAVDIDPRNPRAWVELALTCEQLGERACACVAWHGAATDLPVDGVLVRCQ